MIHAIHVRYMYSITFQAHFLHIIRPGRRQKRLSLSFSALHLRVRSEPALRLVAAPDEQQRSAIGVQKTRLRAFHDGGVRHLFVGVGRGKGVGGQDEGFGAAATAFGGWNGNVWWVKKMGFVGQCKLERNN